MNKTNTRYSVDTEKCQPYEKIEWERPWISIPKIVKDYIRSLLFVRIADVMSCTSFHLIIN